MLHLFFHSAVGSSLSSFWDNLCSCRSEIQAHCLLVASETSSVHCAAGFA